MIVLDFDRVLFDTDRLVKKLKEVDLDTLSRNQELLDAMESNNIIWQDYVNEGVVFFLKERGHECVIVSSYFSRNRGDNDLSEAELTFFQIEKIKRSGLFDLVKETRVVGKEKNDALSDLYNEDESMLLVDDESEHIKIAKKLGYTTVWFRTPKNLSKNIEGGPEFVESFKVHSFKEFVELEKTWSQKK